MSGWPIVVWAAIALGALFGGILIESGAGAEGLHRVVLASAKTSSLLFLSAFLASSLRSWRRTAATRWLIRNRRYVGVSFGVSHAYHLAAVIAFVSSRPDPVSVVVIVFGGFGYLLLAAMVATSNDAAVAWLGVRRWRRLHLFGLYYLWAIFAVTFLGNAIGPKARFPSQTFLALFLVALGARLWLRRRGRVLRRDGVAG